MDARRQFSYFIPQNGVKKVTLRIPESHSLYICPAACGRRNGIRAIKNGEKNRCSFLYIAQEGLISGAYEEQIGEAVETLLSVLEPRPRAFQLYVNCVDDFLGTDEAALIEELERRFPERRFLFFHINPVAAEAAVRPGALMHARLYQFLRPLGTDNGVNFIGNYASLSPDCELFAIFHRWGLGPVRELCSCKTFAEYMDMGKSRLNLVLMPMGEYAAKELRERLGIPYLLQMANYRVNVIRERYTALAEALGRPVPDFRAYDEEARSEIALTGAALSGRKIIVDSSASMCPFALARALLEYGFEVAAIFAMHSKETDAEDEAWLREQHPETAIVCREGFRDVLGYQFGQDNLCLGFDSAFLLRARYFVNMYHDEGYYGYRGLCRLMRKMREALERETEWEGAE